MISSARSCWAHSGAAASKVPTGKNYTNRVSRRDIEVRTALATQYTTNFAAARSADLLRETATLFFAEAPRDESAAENSLVVAFEKNFTAHRERSQGKESDKESRFGEHLEHQRMYFKESESCL